MALVVLNEKKYNAIKQYVKINVKDKSGRETIANIYRRIGISRTAFAKILSGETKRVKPETWFEIEKLLGDILESEESTLYSFTVEDVNMSTILRENKQLKRENKLLKKRLKKINNWSLYGTEQR
jgi:hypothetical protein